MLGPPWTSANSDPAEERLRGGLAGAGSLLIHLCLLLAAAWLIVPRPAIAPTPPSIDVQIILEKSLPTPSPAIAPAPQALAVPENSTAPSAPAPPRSTPATKLPIPQGVPKPEEPTETMTSAKNLYSTALLKEPASREVRETLPTLDRYERITQLCNIEATEQIRRALPKSNPETVSASAFSETNIKDGVFVAPGAAFRSHRNWYELSYRCVVRSDLSGVVQFAWHIGAPIPRDLWDSHDLIAVDADDE